MAHPEHGEEKFNTGNFGKSGSGSPLLDAIRGIDKLINLPDRQDKHQQDDLRRTRRDLSDRLAQRSREGEIFYQQRQAQRRFQKDFEAKQKTLREIMEDPESAQLFNDAKKAAAIQNVLPKGTPTSVREKFLPKSLRDQEDPGLQFPEIARLSEQEVIY